MSTRDTRNRETHLIEVLLSGLDARESARGAASPLLVYLADMVVERSLLELAELRSASANWLRDVPSNGTTA